VKKYIISSLIFISLISLYIYTQDNNFTTLNIGGEKISLPNAVWVLIFLLLFFIFTLIFFLAINFKTYVFQKNIKKDILTIINNIKNKILYINSFKETKTLKDINNFVKNIEGLKINPIKQEKFEFLEDIDKLLKGETIEIGKYKLKEDNPWFILNIKNRLKNNPSYAKEVLKKFKNETLKKEAFYIWATTKESLVKEILKYDYEINMEIIKAHIDDKDLPLLLKKAKLTPKEEVEVAKLIYNQNPEEELKIVENLPYAKSYLAIKYSHFDLAKEIVEKSNIKIFEYYLNLKDKVSIDEYLETLEQFR